MEGYDAKFHPPLEKRLECPICLLAQRDPMQTPCGHRFCAVCIQRALRLVLGLFCEYVRVSCVDVVYKNCELSVTTLNMIFLVASHCIDNKIVFNSLLNYL